MPIYAVFLIQEYGEPRNHHALWVQTDKDRGVQYHVIGPVDNGAMQYETKRTYSHPSTSMTFVSMQKIGQISSDDLQRMDDACKGNPPPIMQMRDGERLYPDVPLRRCQEWTAEMMELLKKSGVIVSK